MHYVYDDGGRAQAGFRGDAGDCVTRAIAIAAQMPYQQVYDELSGHVKASPKAVTRGGRKKVSARDGVPRRIWQCYLEGMGWKWTPTMQIGSGCTVHLHPDELPGGRIICRVSKHLCAVIDGVIHDTHDPSREGTRCVYGYWIAKEGWKRL
jgi:hypothetical protein